MKPEEMGFYPTEFRLKGFDRLTIEWRGDDRWIVKHMTQVLNKKGEFEWEPSPSNRTEAFIKRTRFSFDEAFEKALEIVKTDPYFIRETEINKALEAKK
jgi:hypothetical protein